MASDFEFTGKAAQAADPLVVKDLKKRGLLLKTQEIVHSYPFCWRCDTPLIYYARSSWLIKVTAVKDRLIAANRSVNWMPDTIKEGRMGNFLENVIDWGLSRDRYWGTPLPVWVCPDCGEIEVIGSKAELQEKCGAPDTIELHRPYVDELTCACKKCGGRMKRTPEVIDCWFDSGSMPFAQYHYPFENKALFDETFPADFISEAVDQTRGWFYTLLVISTILFDKAPFKNCIVLGHVNDKNGVKMSKHKGNVVDPYALSEMFGVDALRFFLLRTFPFGSDGNFSNELLIGTINTDLANKLGNLVSRTTGMAEKYFGGKLPVQREDAPEDCELKKMACALRDRYQAEMDKLQLQNGLDEVFKVIDRANKYIDETAPWALGKDENKRERLAAVLYNLLETIRICTTLLLPVMPDTCDKIFAKLGADEACRSWDNANVWGVLPAGAQISKGENLFPRIDVDEALAKLDELQEQQKKAALPAVELEPYVEDEVDFDTFLKSDFRAVKIKNCEAVKKSDKLLKFTLDDGSGTDRIILSGIHQYYEPEQLIGKTAIAILNLPPRKMMGIPSCGMLISAVHKEKGEEKLHLMLIDDSVPAGAKLC